jgi:dUTP pyrophosphatase
MRETVLRKLRMAWSAEELARLAKGEPALPVPEHKTVDAAGLDLCAADSGGETLPNKSYVIPLGVCIELPRGTFGMLVPRGSLSNHPSNPRLANSVGIVDADYRGELMARVVTDGGWSWRRGDRLFQLVVVTFLACELEVFDQLSVTLRGEGRHGSTGARG